MTGRASGGSGGSGRCERGLGEELLFFLDDEGGGGGKDGGMFIVLFDEVLHEMGDGISRSGE